MVPVPIAEITRADLEKLQKAISIDPNKPALDDVLREIVLGTARLWRHRNIVIVTEVHEKTKALFVTWAGGELGFFHPTELVEELKRVAREAGLEHVDAVAVRPEIGNVLERAGAREVARRFVLEV